MHQNNAWWPLSEVSDEERDRILSLPPKMREARLQKLKQEIKSGALARRQKHEAIDRRGQDG